MGYRVDWFKNYELGQIQIPYERQASLLEPLTFWSVPVVTSYRLIDGQVWKPAIVFDTSRPSCPILVK
jgi:hypothetical protein